MCRVQCNVAFRYQLGTCSRTEENQGKPYSSRPVAGPSGCKLTSSRQSGIKDANPNISPYLAVALFDISAISESRRMTGNLPIISLGDKPLQTQDHTLLFQLDPCGHNPNVTSSLARKWVRLLQFLLAFASGNILGSESQGPHDHILLSQIRDFPNMKGHVPVFTYPRHCLAFASFL
jgi:hypothetical protein